MSIQSGGVVVRILGDDSDLNKKLKDSANQLAKWGVAAASAAAVGAVEITRRTAAAAKEVDNLSRLVGANTVIFQRNAAAAKSVGIEQDKLADIYKDAQDKVGDFLATGAGPMVDYFEKVAPLIGQTAAEFENLSGPQVLQKYVDGLEAAGVSQSKMTFYLEALASDATLLAPLLVDAGAGFQELGDRAEATGAVLSEIDIAKMGLLQESMDAGREAAQGLTNTIAKQLAPVLMGLADLYAENGASAESMRKGVEKAFGYTIKAAGFVGNAVRGIQVIIKGLEAAFWALNAVSSEIFEQMAKGVEKYLVRPAMQSVNALIDGMNKVLPGSLELDRMVTGESALVAQLTAISDASSLKMKEIGLELHELMMQPIPSEALDDFVALSQRKAEEAAANIVKIKNHTGLVVPDLTAIKMAEEASEEEIELAKKTAAALKAIKDQQFRDNMAATAKMFGDLSSLMNTESRSLFEIGKVAAISQAAVDGISAAISSYKAGAKIGGPIVGAGFAAASVTATGVMISNLASQSFGGGAKGTAAPSVGGLGGLSEEQTPGQAAQAGQSAGATDTLFVEGLSGNGMIDMVSARALAQKLLDYQSDGGQVVLGQ